MKYVAVLAKRPWAHHQTIASRQSTISHAQYKVMSEYICKLWVVEIRDVVLLFILL